MQINLATPRNVVAQWGEFFSVGAFQFCVPAFSIDFFVNFNAVAACQSPS
jgi:hypothetical protein